MSDSSDIIFSHVGSLYSRSDDFRRGKKSLKGIHVIYMTWFELVRVSEHYLLIRAMVHINLSKAKLKSSDQLVFGIKLLLSVSKLRVWTKHFFNSMIASNNQVFKVERNSSSLTFNRESRNRPRV